MSPSASTESLAAIILAAGKGTRMKSALPKVLHPVAHRPMVLHVLDLARAVEASPRLAVVGQGAEAVVETIAQADPDAQTVLQDPPLGTGHAVHCAMAALSGFEGDVLVLYGDTPLLRAETVAKLRAARAAGGDPVVLGFHAPAPSPYGRLVTVDLDTTGPEEAVALDRIVEAHEASAEEAALTFCNSGVMLFSAGLARACLPQLSNDNKKGEYYLTDLVALAQAAGGRALAVSTAGEDVLGVNSRVELGQVEKIFQSRAREAAQTAGVTLEDPETVYFSFDTVLDRDVTVGPNVVFGPGVRVGEGSTIRAFSHLEGARVGAGATIGPFARLRPGAELAENVHIGNFVEIKKATLAPGVKVNHLSYVGDASVGRATNIGAGTITCNYDGFFKSRTVIGEEVFIGSNTCLVAPVTLGDQATTGAGSVITKDVPKAGLSLTRAPQKVLENWSTRFRSRRKAEKEKNNRG